MCVYVCVCLSVCSHGLSVWIHGSSECSYNLTVRSHVLTVCSYVVVV